MLTHPVIAGFRHEFARARTLSEGAARQLSFSDLRVALDPETNSIAVIMKHVGGNLRSRWTDPFTSDGEKPWRNRDTEFVDDFADADALWACWQAGWSTLDAALARFTDTDLPRALTIRGEPHTLALALTRSMAHTAYHAGQIVQVARALASRRGTPWKTLTVHRGTSAAFNAGLGFDPANPGRESPA
jgi:uncharacterized damage-inducible protein DinB